MNDGRKWAVGYAAYALIIGLAFIAVSAPFQAPDEVGHYWRAAAMANGAFAPAAFANASPSARVPHGVKDLVAATWVDTAGKPEVKVGAERLRNARMLPLRRGEPVGVKFPAYYTPVPYLPEAAVLWAAFKLDVKPLVAFYAGRAVNLLAMVALVVAAILIAPSAAWVFAAAGALPMTLFISASYSPDAVTFGLAAVALALAVTQRRYARYATLVAVIALLLALCKPVYFLIPLLAMWNRNVKPQKRGATAMVLAIAMIAGIAISAIAASRASFDMRGDVRVDAKRQLSYLVRNPVRFATTVANDYAERHRRYRHEMVGRLGLLDVELPLAVSTFAQIALLGTALTASRVVSAPQRVTGFAILLAMIAAVSLSLYLQWTPVGAGIVDGIQGRYFIPLIAPFAAVVQAYDARRVHGIAGVLFFAAVTLLNFVGVYRVFERNF